MPKICIVCGKPIKYCGHCDDYQKKNRWKNSYCSENCREVFRTCSNYEGKLLSIEEAYAVLKTLKIDNVLKSVKASVDKIMSYKPVKSVVAEEKAKVELEMPEIAKTEVIQEIAQEAFRETPQETPQETERPKHRPRRKRLKKTEE